MQMTENVNRIRTLKQVTILQSHHDCMLKSFANPVCSNSRMTGGGAYKIWGAICKRQPLGSSVLFKDVAHEKLSLCH